MTSKTSSPDLFDALITHEYNDVTGTVTVNVADALMAIATAINRLAACNEAMVTRGEKISAQLKQAIQQDSDGPGHA